MRRRGLTYLLLHIDNQSVVHIKKSLVSTSPPLMRELRRLKCFLDQLRIHARSEWIPSVANKFADALSRSFRPDDLWIRQRLWHSVLSGMRAPLDAFPHRPLEAHPVFQRKEAYQELETDWDSQVRLLCPPIDLISPTLQKVHKALAPSDDDYSGLATPTMAQPCF